MAYVSKEDKLRLAVGIRQVCDEYGVKCSISVRNFSALVVKLKSGKVDFSSDFIPTGNAHPSTHVVDVNVYHINSRFKGQSLEFLLKLRDAMRGDLWYDESDSMTDYFHVSHYTYIYIGSSDVYRYTGPVPLKSDVMRSVAEQNGIPVVDVPVACDDDFGADIIGLPEVETVPEKPVGQHVKLGTDRMLVQLNTEGDVEGRSIRTLGYFITDDVRKVIMWAHENKLSMAYSWWVCIVDSDQFVDLSNWQSTIPIDVSIDRHGQASVTIPPSVEELRQSALAKLTTAEKIALGIDITGNNA